MTIKFAIETRDADERDIQIKFIRSLIASIKKEVLVRINNDKAKSCMSKVLESSRNSIQYNNPYFMINDLLNNITFTMKNGMYIIKFSNRRVNGSDITYDMLARFIDRGNEKFKGIHIISHVFMIYRKNINKYWKFFINRELGRMYVREVIVVK